MPLPNKVGSYIGLLLPEKKGIRMGPPLALLHRYLMTRLSVKVVYL
jgi:hypothetical protein